MTIRSVGIIGAGFAGLSTAKVLRAFGFEVTVFEKEPDVGGVWAASRRYPGLTTQNPRTTYALSDFPMPASYPEWPSGQQVQAGEPLLKLSGPLLLNFAERLEIAEHHAEAGGSSAIDSHTRTNSLLRHDATTMTNVRIDTSDEPNHQELCDREQAYFLRAIWENLDLGDHLADAVNSLRIVLAADQSVKTGNVIHLP